MLVKDPLSMGSDISWLSAFPNEKEFLYPPLTFLRPLADAAEKVEVAQGLG